MVISKKKVYTFSLIIPDIEMLRVKLKFDIYSVAYRTLSANILKMFELIKIFLF